LAPTERPDLHDLLGRYRLSTRSGRAVRARNSRRLPYKVNMMPTADRYIQDSINKFLIPLRRGGRTQRTLDAYKYLLLRDLSYLRDNGLHYTPSSIGSTEIEFLIANKWVDSPKYNHNRRSLFRQFLQYHGNRICDEYPEPTNASMRVKVDWLSDIEAVQVYRACTDPLEKMIIHLELRLALRRFDMLNLTMGDIHDSHIDVLGKGHKYRSVPFVKDTVTVLKKYMEYRDTVTSDRSSNGPFLMIARYGSHKPGKTFVDTCVKDVCSRAVTRPVSNHTLRRTCARMWYRAGVPLSTISSLLGHSDEKTTVKYLGLSLDDLNNGASLYDVYFDDISRSVDDSKHSQTPCRENGAKLNIASKNGGLGVI
jgi:integrase